MKSERATLNGIACLLSDCDGVIVDSELVADEILVEILRVEFGRDDIAALAHGLFGMTLLELIRVVEQRAGCTLSDVRRIELQQEIDRRLAERTPFIEGTRAVYESLGLPVAVVSNSAYPRLHRCVERAGLLPLVGEHVYAASEVGRPKPAPDGYLHAAQRLGVPPAQCLVIEDSLTGIAAARAAGMPVLGFTGGSHIGAGHARQMQEAGVLATFASMQALPALLRA